MAATPSATPSLDLTTPIEKIKAGIPTENSPAFAYAVKQSDYAASGVIDARHRIAELVSIEVEARPVRFTTTTMLLTAKKTWIKVHTDPAGVDLPGLPKTWMLIDPARMRTADGSPLRYVAGQSDPGDAGLVCARAASVKQTSPGHFRGTVDLGSSEAGEILSNAELKALGSKADILPFTAELDSQGRLTKMSISMPAAGTYPARIHEIDYDQYWTAAVPKIPTPAEQTKAPAIFYKEFSGTWRLIDPSADRQERTSAEEPGRDIA